MPKREKRTLSYRPSTESKRMAPRNELRLQVRRTPVTHVRSMSIDRNPGIGVEIEAH
jgi:hypothetical protein